MAGRKWLLTPEAGSSLADIARWTVEAFGPLQTEAYEQDLVDVCHAIASGAAHTQSCKRLLAPNAPEDLRFSRSGQHFVIFVETENQVVILDFLHSRSNLAQHISALASGARSDE